MTLVTSFLTLWPWGRTGVLTLSIPTYHLNMVMVKGHLGRQMSISWFDLWPLISDLEIQISTLRHIPLFVYGPKEHSYAFIALSYQNCRRSSRKYVKMAKKRKWPWWPRFWPCDLEVVQVCWPYPHLPTIWIGWWSEFIKIVKRPFQGLTFDPLYLTLKVQRNIPVRL